jgi:hypothetical protein
MKNHLILLSSRLLIFRIFFLAAVINKQEFLKKNLVYQICELYSG